MIDNFWTGWFELGLGIAIALLWNTAGARYLNCQKTEKWIAANLALMFIFCVCSLLVMVRIVKHKKYLLITALVCFSLTCLLSAALFFAGIYSQTQG